MKMLRAGVTYLLFFYFLVASGCAPWTHNNDHHDTPNSTIRPPAAEKVVVPTPVNTWDDSTTAAAMGYCLANHPYKTIEFEQPINSIFERGFTKSGFEIVPSPGLVGAVRRPEVVTVDDGHAGVIVESQSPVEFGHRGLLMCTTVSPDGRVSEPGPAVRRLLEWFVGTAAHPPETRPVLSGRGLE